PDETSIDRSTGTHHSSSAPHHLHRKRLQNRRFYYRRASIARTRSHPPPLITNTEKKASLKPSPNTTGERQSEPKAGDARQRTPSPPPETKAGESRVEEASTSRKQSRRRWICKSLHLPETKPNLTNRLHPTNLPYDRVVTPDAAPPVMPVHSPRRPGPELRQGDRERTRRGSRGTFKRKSEGLRRTAGASRAGRTPDPKS
ncbi:hypothetical protein HID58_072944, partial [Brassica napus]